MTCVCAHRCDVTHLSIVMFRVITMTGLVLATKLFAVYMAASSRVPGSRSAAISSSCVLACDARFWHTYTHAHTYTNGAHWLQVRKAAHMACDLLSIQRPPEMCVCVCVCVCV